MVNPAFSESQLKNLRRQNRHLASTHRRKLVFLQASRNPAHGSGRPFFVRDVPVPASFCSAPVASAFAPPAPVSAAPQLRPFCLSPPRSDEKEAARQDFLLRESRMPNETAVQTKRRCERKEAVRTRQTTSPAGSEAGAGISCGISYGISCAMRVPVRRPCPPPVPACIPRPHPAASSRMRAVQAL